MSKKEKKIKIVPRGKQILVVVDAPEARTNDYGIVVPDEVEQERKAQGTVVAVGPDVRNVEEGERVIYGAFAGEALKITENGKKVDYKLLDDADVIAFIR